MYQMRYFQYRDDPRSNTRVLTQPFQEQIESFIDSLNVVYTQQWNIRMAAGLESEEKYFHSRITFSLIRHNLSVLQELTDIISQVDRQLLYLSNEYQIDLAVNWNTRSIVQGKQIHVISGVEIIAYRESEEGA